MVLGRLLMQEDMVRVKFGGDLEGVDVNTFTRIMLDYALVAQEAAREVTPSTSMRVNIRAVERGCLEALLQISPEDVKGALELAKASLPLVPEIIKVATDFYHLRQEVARHGEVDSHSPSGKETVVRMRDGNTVNVDSRTYNIFVSSPDASEAVGKTFEALGQYERVSSLSISGCGRDAPDFEARRDEFPALAQAPAAPPRERKDGLYSRQGLRVIRAIFEKSTTRKWLFGWNDMTISAAISDEEFFDRFPDMSFKMNDVLEADLRVVQEYNASAGVYENRSYEVVRVWSKRNVPETQRMDV